MFNLEALLAPFILGYLDKYIKLKANDLQLSLWGGDVVLNKLDLRLNVIEELIDLPISFKSGIINELRIHIPWTKITSEPVLITINTLEFVATLKDKKSTATKTDSTDDSSSQLIKANYDLVKDATNSDNSNDTDANQNDLTTTTVQPDTSSSGSISTSYLQTIINKILFNIRVTVNNMIVKFVEDDLVFSLHMKSGEFYSVNSVWEEEYLDTSATTANLDIRKLIKLNDITLCLDERDACGKVNYYNEPIVYRCSLESRFQINYPFGINKRPYLIISNIYFKKLKISTTDSQLPIIIRLIRLFTLYYDDVQSTPVQTRSNSLNNVKNNEFKNDFNLDAHTNLAINNVNYGENEVKQVVNEDEGSDEGSENEEKEEANDGDQQTWTSWMWSYVPSIYSSTTSDATNDNSNNVNGSSIMLFGLYFDEITIVFKSTHTETFSRYTSYNSSLICSLKGIAYELTSKEEGSDMILGISKLRIEADGPCCCALSTITNENENVILTIGADSSDSANKKGINYMSNSLFDATHIEVNIDTHQKFRDKFGNVDQNYCITRFGGVFVNYCQTLRNELKSIDNYIPQNKLNLFLIFNKFNVYVSANCIHRVNNLIEVIVNSTTTKNDSLKEKKVESEKPAEAADYSLLFDSNFIFKDVQIKLLPYLHNRIIEPSNDTFTNRHYFLAKSTSINVKFTKPSNKLSESMNLSKIKIYEMYNHIYVDSNNLEAKFIIENSDLTTLNEYSIIEPLYFQFHYSYLDHSSKTYATCECSLDLPSIKLVVYKPLLFIINDYIESYLLFDKFQHSSVQIAFIRKLMYKNLCNFLINEPQNRLKLIVKELKFKYSLKDIFQTFKTSCSQINIDLLSNQDIDGTTIVNCLKNESTNEVLSLEIQFPLIKDDGLMDMNFQEPLYLHCFVNEINVNVINELMAWLTYVPITQKIIATELTKNYQSNRSFKPEYDSDGIYMHKLCKVSNREDLSDIVEHQSPQTKLSSVKRESTIENFYELLRYLSINIQIKQIKVHFNGLNKSNKHEVLCVHMPLIDVRNNETKGLTDKSKIAADKFPWILQFKNLQIFTENENKQKEYIINDLEIFSTFAVTYKYENRVKILSFAFHSDFLKGIYCDINTNQLLFITEIMLVLLNSIELLSFAIDLNTYTNFHANNDNLNSSNCYCLNKNEKQILESTKLINTGSMLNILEECDLLDFDQMSQSNVSSIRTVVQNTSQKLKFSYWIQFTAFKFSFNLNDERTKLNLSIEDVCGFMDLHKIYQKVSLKLGTVSVNYQTLTDNGEWMPSHILDGVALDSSNYFNKEVFVEDHLTATSTTSLNKKEPASTGGFLNFTFTRATVKNYKRKFDKIVNKIKIRENSTENNMYEHEDNNLLISPEPSITNTDFRTNNSIYTQQNSHNQSSGNFNSNSTKNKNKCWIAELDFSLKNLDFIYHSQLVELLCNLLSNVSKLYGKNGTTKTINDENVVGGSQSEPSYVIPYLQAVDVPLMNIKVDKIRVVYPVVDSSKQFIYNSSNLTKDALKKLEFPLLILQILKIHLTNELDNPVSRTLNHQNQYIYNELKTAGLLYRPGFILEDRQYLCKIEGFSIFQSNSIDFNNNSIFLIKRYDENIYSNPALLWNYIQEENVDDLVLYRSKNKNFKINHYYYTKLIVDVFNLNATFGLPIIYVNNNIRYFISGYIAEIHLVTQGINFYICNKTLELLYSAIDECNKTITAAVNKFVEPMQECTKSAPQIDVSTSSSAKCKELEIVPIDVLVTAEKFNFFLYLSTNEFKCKEPLLYACIFQPYTCLSLHNNLQKLEISVFDFKLKLAGHNSKAHDSVTQSFLPNFDDFLFDLIECKNGEANPKTGVKPGFLAIKIENGHLKCDTSKILNRTCSDASNSQIDLKSECKSCDITYLDMLKLTSSICFEKPIKVSLNWLYLDKLKKILNDLSSNSNEFNIKVDTKEYAQPSDESLNWHIFKFCKNLSLTTCQICFHIEHLEKNFDCKLATECIRSNICFIDNSKLVKLNESCDDKIKVFVEFNDLLLSFNNNLSSDSTLRRTIGSYTFGVQLNYELNSKECSVDFNTDSLRVSINRSILNSLSLTSEIFNEFYTKLFGCEGSTSEEIRYKYFKTTRPDFDDGAKHVVSEDDIRSGSLSYVKEKRPVNKDEVFHIPNVNEITFRDEIEDVENKLSYICWRYREKRALVTIQIQPIPFLTNSNLDVAYTKNDKKAKCYLECYCSSKKSFIVVKEFFIQEEKVTKLLDYKNDYEKLCSSLDFHYSNIWRIRISEEGKNIISSESLLACTKVDSLYMDRKAPNNYSPIYHANLNIRNFEINLTDNQPNVDIACVNFNDLSFTCLLTNNNKHVEIINLSVVGQLLVDYVEYRFLSVYPLIEPINLKGAMSALIKENNCDLRASIKLSEMMVNISQSSIDAVNRICDHWLNEPKSLEISGLVANSIPKSNYFIINDTNLVLHIKQYETDETCVLNSGESTNYSWRTHKKAQLLQVYLPNYKQYSVAFCINKACSNELKFKIKQKPNSFDEELNLIVLIEETDAFKYKIRIQTKFLLCNFLNCDLNICILSGKFGELNSQEIINTKSRLPAFSRSSHTYAIIETTNFDLKKFEISYLKVADAHYNLLVNELGLNFEKLKNGILCENKEFKFWLNLYIQKYKREVQEDSKETGDITQYNLIFTPLAVICSYIPYSLNINIMQKADAHGALVKEKADLVRSYSTHYINNFKSSNAFIAFNYEEHTTEETVENKDVIELNVSEFDIERKKLLESELFVDDNSFNVKTLDGKQFKASLALCASDTDKQLTHANVFKYFNIMYESILVRKEPNEIQYIQPRTWKNVANKGKGSTQQDEFISKLVIEKSACWSFSNTIRINISPTCLMVNKTKYNLKIIYRNSITKDNIYDTVLNLNSESELCFPPVTSYNNVKFIITNQRLNNSNTANFESDFIKITNDADTVYTKETNVLNSKGWVDVKLKPVIDDNYENQKNDQVQEEFLKLINLVLQSKWSDTDSSGIRLLVIKPKFLLHNKTDLNFQIQIKCALDEKKLSNLEYLKKFAHISPQEHYETSEIYDKVKQTRLLPLDLCYLNIFNINSHVTNKKFIVSKDMILCSEDAPFKINQQSNSQTYLSRQSFCIYEIDNLNEDYFNCDTITRFYTCVQKLCVEDDGCLRIMITMSEKSLIKIYNCLQKPIYVWPRLTLGQQNPNRLSSSSIEAYLKEFDGNISLQLSKDEAIVVTERMNVEFLLLHYIPPKCFFNFTVDFVGNDCFPENIEEKVVIQFGVKDLVSDQECIKLSSLNNLCYLYDNNYQIVFSAKEQSLYYTTIYGEENNLIRFITNFNLKSECPVNNKCDDFHFNRTKRIANCENRSPFFNINMKINLLCDVLCVKLIHDYLSEKCQTEILCLSGRSLDLNLQTNNKNDHELINLYLTFKHIQIDNQMYETNGLVAYDFPVIFIPQATTNENDGTRVRRLSTRDSPSRNSETGDGSEKFLSLGFCFSRHQPSGQLNYSLVKAKIKVNPFELFLEDCFLYNISKIIVDFVKVIKLTNDTDDSNSQISKFSGGDVIDNLILIRKNEFLTNLTNGFSFTNSNLDNIAYPVIMYSLYISKIDALVSLRSSVKIHLTSNKMPISLEEFCIKLDSTYIFTSSQLIKLMTKHYASSLIYRAGWLLGSLDLIGSPTVFIQRFTDGIYDFVYLPYQGIQETGLSGFISGLTSGSISLLYNISAGTITSLTSFAAFISRNMDNLSYDPEYLARQEELRHQPTHSFSTGIAQISVNFFVTLIGAIGGLAEQPIQSITNSDSFLKGLSKGIIGFITKPIGAVAQLVNQTGEEILKVAGVNRIPSMEKRLNRSNNKEFNRFSISLTKCAWKLLNQRVTKRYFLHSIIEAVHNSVNNAIDSDIIVNLSSCYLLLTDEILFIIDKEEDIQNRAYFISEISVSNPTKLDKDKDFSLSLDSILDVKLNVRDVTANKTSSHDKVKDRVFEYVQQVNKRPSDTQQQLEGINDEGDKSNVNQSSNNKHYIFFVDPHHSKSFIQKFNLLKRQITNKIF